MESIDVGWSVGLNAGPSEPEAAAAQGAARSAAADPLLTCLLVVARAHGLPANAEGAVAGLPLVRGRLVPSLFERAAHRIASV